MFTEVLTLLVVTVLASNSLLLIVLFNDPSQHSRCSGGMNINSRKRLWPISVAMSEFVWRDVSKLQKA
jgi:hypothetical protein